MCQLASDTLCALMQGDEKVFMLGLHLRGLHRMFCRMCFSQGCTRVRACGARGKAMVS